MTYTLSVYWRRPGDTEWTRHFEVFESDMEPRQLSDIETVRLLEDHLRAELSDHR